MLLLLLLLITVVPASLKAQPNQGPQLPVAERVTRTIERLKPELDLTNDQAKSMTPVYTSFYTAMDKLREGGKQPTTEDRQKQIAERDEQLKAILTADQMKKLKELEEEMRKKRPS
jgi:Spy/CpxP family protein refolding chaperone